MSSDCIQERFAPKLACFGCGPANEKGLRLRSFPESDEACYLEWQPETCHEAFEGMLSGGIIGTLLDCHLNWTAAWHLMQRDGLDKPPCCVTANYSIVMKRPTPTDGLIRVDARIVRAEGDRAEVHGELRAGGKVCATGEGLFVAVKPGHPAYHRW